MRYCTNCGQESAHKICHSCGVKSNKTHNFCEWCGSSINEAASICTNCGEQVNINKIPLMLKIAHICLIVLFLMFSTVAGGGSSLFLILAALVLFPFSDRMVKKVTHSANGATVGRTLGYTAQLLIAFALFICATSLAAQEEPVMPTWPVDVAYTELKSDLANKFDIYPEDIMDMTGEVIYNNENDYIVAVHFKLFPELVSSSTFESVEGSVAYHVRGTSKESGFALSGHKYINDYYAYSFDSQLEEMKAKWKIE